MRGGSQAHLVQGRNGRLYVAKFTSNPQGTRTLINEWFVYQFLQHLGISTPHLQILRWNHATKQLPKNLTFLEENSQLSLEFGFHLGSQVPVDPQKTAIYDYCPQSVIHRVANPEDFAKTLVLDLLLGHAERRQAIFVREVSRKDPWLLRAYMIDHGQNFGGAVWKFPTCPIKPLYFNKTIYSICNLDKIYSQTLDQISSITDQMLHHFSERIPAIWFTPNDRTNWSYLLSQLTVRRLQLPGLLYECLQSLGASNRTYRVKHEGHRTRSLRC